MAAFDAQRFQTLFEEVWNELHRLQSTWTVYFGLYGTGDSVELLRSTAVMSFGVIQEIMIEVIYLRTHRLLDAAVSGGKRTASIESLIQSLPPSACSIGRPLRKKLDAVRRDCETLAEWRDRQVAHRDLATALRQHPSPLRPVEARTIRRAIDFLAGALSEISDECHLDRPYRIHQEMADMDIHKVIDRLRAGRDR
jgi:hypothetical protein